MPTRKKPASPYDEIAKIDTYGSPTKGKSQFAYDRAAFAKRWGPERGCPPRSVLFRRLADHMVPGRFEWHDWTMKVVEPCCGEHGAAPDRNYFGNAGVSNFLGYSGTSNCVAGHTRILNPLTGEQPTIQYLCENLIAPVVMTLQGPVQAEIPYLKGHAEIFEIVLDNGSKFEATGKHRVLTSTGFSFVESLAIGQSLYSYSPTHRASTSEPALSTHGQDARNSSQTVEDSQFCCQNGLSLYGEQLRCAREACQGAAPSQGDALEHNHENCIAGGLVSKCEHSHADPQCDRLSNSGASCRRNSLGMYELPRFGLETRAPCHDSFQLSPLSLLENRIHWPSGSQDPGFERTRSAFGPLWPSEYFFEGEPIAAHRQYLPCANNRAPKHKNSARYAGSSRKGIPLRLPIGSPRPFVFRNDFSDRAYSSAYKVAQGLVVSIKKIGKANYYDISVPGPEHYFAEGCIHHNSAKTFNITGFAITWWLADPMNSSVFLCSTTMGSIRKRAWAQVQSYYDSLEANGMGFGNLVNTSAVWQSQPGDNLHAIFCKAVAEGNISKTVSDIVGVHTKRQMLVIDESEGVAPAIWTAPKNLYAYPMDSGGEFIMIAIANARFRLSQYGRYIEPKNGWNSVTPEVDEWEGKPFVDGQPPVMVYRFDFRRSPNVIAGKQVSKHLPGKARVEAKLKALKERGGENDPDHWCYDLGFPAPEGLAVTVFTESMIEKYGGYGRHEFTGQAFMIIGAFDQAFGGGDRPCLKFGAMGLIKGNTWGIEWLATELLYVDASSSDPARYQLMKQLQKHCQAVKYRGQLLQCDPKNLAIDCTGEGGLADIIQREWSPDIIRIQFSGACSDNPCSLEDPRLSSEVYLNKRAEMSFRTRDMLMSGQLKGIDKDTAVEMCSIEYRDSKDGKQIKIKLQPKDEYKKKFGKSCDLYDSGIMLSEVGRLRGLRIQAIGHTVRKVQAFSRVAERAQAVYEDDDKLYHSEAQMPVQDDEPETEELGAIYADSNSALD